MPVLMFILRYVMRTKNIKSQKGGGVCYIGYARYARNILQDKSIEQQLAACQQKAQELNIPLIGFYEDRADSKKTYKRPGFQKLMRDAKRGKFSYVVAFKANQIGYDVLDTSIYERKLKDCGIRIIYAAEVFKNDIANDECE